MKKAIFMAGEIVSALFFCMACVQRIADVMNTPIDEQPDNSSLITVLVGFFAFAVIMFVDWLLKDSDK